MAVAAFEEHYLRRALQEARGHIGRTAEIAGLSRRSVAIKMTQYELEKSKFRPGKRVEE